MTDSPSYLSERVLERVDKSRANLTWLSGELAQRPDGLGLQLSRVCELVNLALGQVEDHGDLGMAWILLEQARQQLGHAAVMAAKGGVRRGARANEAALTPWRIMSSQRSAASSASARRLTPNGLVVSSLVRTMAFSSSAKVIVAEAMMPRPPAHRLILMSPVQCKAPQWRGQ